MYQNTHVKQINDRNVKGQSVNFLKVEVDCDTILKTGGSAVTVLCYKSEGHWFDPSWCQWSFSLT